MSGNFSPEIYIANNLRRYLIDEGYTIFQLISPGGQCGWSLLYHDSSGDRRTCYPDLICFSNEKIILGEAKPKYSDEDRKKLIAIKNSLDGSTNLRNMLTRKYNREFNSVPIEFVLIHGDQECPKNI